MEFKKKAAKNTGIKTVEDDCSGDFVVLATVGSTKGLKGHLKLNIVSDSSLDFFNNFYLVKSESDLNKIANKLDRELDSYIKLAKKNLISDSGKSANTKFLLKLSEINSPEDAKKYTHWLLCVKRDDLPKLEKGEYYWSDLQGLSVYNLDEVYLGAIDYLMETGSNDVMFVEDKNLKKIRCLPYLDSVVVNIDITTGKMIVDWDEDF